MSGKRVAIVGVTGAVGAEMLEVLAERDFPISDLKVLASARSKGKEVSFNGNKLPVEELTAQSFKGVELALFSAGGDRSKEFAPIAAAAGAVVVDNSSAFRMDPGTPLVVPEVNSEDIPGHNGIIANPNCSTIVMVVPLFPIYKLARIRRVVVATYQAVSGAGAQAILELENQTRAALEGKPLEKNVFCHPIAFNLFVHRDPKGEDGFVGEERKMIRETHKIFHDDSIAIHPTCIRVPVFRAHSESIYLELERPVELEEVREALDEAPGVRIVDNPEKRHYPMPIEASGGDDILVGHIRRDPFNEKALSIFVSGDQLRKGAALNAVQIAERL